MSGGCYKQSIVRFSHSCFVKTPEMTCHVEFVKLNAVFSFVSEQFIGGLINHE